MRYLIAIECDWFSTTLSHEGFNVILEVTTDAEQMMNYRNIVSLQLVRWSNARQHQQLR